METLTWIVLVPMVYLAFAVFIFGAVWRIGLLLRRPSFKPTLKIFPERKPAWLFALGDTFLLPTVRRANIPLWIVLMSFHVGMFLLLIGHLELFADFSLFQIIPHEIFLGKGVVGLVICLALLYLLFRRFGPPAKDLSVPEDYLLLILLLLTALFGAEMDWARRWYGYDFMSPDDYRDYLLSLAHFRPDIAAVTDTGHTFMLGLHVFFANLLLIFLPFSKIMHTFFALPVNLFRRA